MSGGEQQMLALGRALMLAPKILLVDEPSVGLAPILVSRTIDKIKELKERFNLTVLMAEQNFNQAIRIADRGYVIVHGKIAFEGSSADELNNNDLIRKFYLGLVSSAFRPSPASEAVQAPRPEAEGGTVDPDSGRWCPVDVNAATVRRRFATLVSWPGRQLAETTPPSASARRTACRPDRRGPPESPASGGLRPCRRRSTPSSRRSDRARKSATATVPGTIAARQS